MPERGRERAAGSKDVMRPDTVYEYRDDVSIDYLTDDGDDENGKGDAVVMVVMSRMCCDS